MNRKFLPLRNSFLIAALILVGLVSPTGAASSSAHRDSRTPTRLPVVDSLPAIDPLPTYSITWTAIGKSMTDTTDISGTRLVSDRKIVMAGSGIWRIYASGLVDMVPNNLTVTDDSHSVETKKCHLTNNQTGVSSVIGGSTITDANRYTGGQSMLVNINAPIQRPDHSWYMQDPFSPYPLNMPFSYQTTSDSTDCYGQTSHNTFTSQSDVYKQLLSPGDLEGDAQGRVFTKNTQFVNDQYGDQLAVQWNVTVRVLDGHDLTVDRLEVTQGLQDSSNSIPLVQGRPTVVRAYIGIGQDTSPVPFVTGILTGYVGSTVLGTVLPFNPPGYIVAPADPVAHWQQIENTLNFQLPYPWTFQPALRLEVAVNPHRLVVETDYTNNKLAASVAFLPCGGASVAYTPVHYTPPGGFNPPDPGKNISAGAEFMKKIYPLSESGLKYSMLPSTPVTSNINGAGVNQFTLDLLTKQLSTGAGHIFAWFPALAYGHGGASDTPGVAAFGNDTESPDAWRAIFAHEIGHNYGFDQADSSLTTAGRHWFDVFERAIKPVPSSIGGNELRDFMAGGPESELWISPLNYEFLVGKICSGALPPTPLTQAPAAADTLLVTGLVSNTTPATGSLQPLYHFTTVPTYTLPVGSQVCVNLKDSGGTLLNQYCFNPGFADGSGTPAAAIPFGIVVPYPPGLSRVELFKGATLLDSRVASTSSPTVTLTFPNAAGLTLAGSQNITWTGSDLDGDPLTYNILYTRDNGATWVGIGSGLKGTAYNLDFSGLAGTTGASGKIKVMASDGFSSTEGISANPFTIANKPPVALITSPPSGATFTTGPKVVLEAAGMDLQDGSLGGSAFSWASNIDGPLGTGQLLEVNLSPWVHTITLTATDSGGLTGTASIQITVVQPTAIKHLFLPTIKR